MGTLCRDKDCKVKRKGYSRKAQNHILREVASRIAYHATTLGNSCLGTWLHRSPKTHVARHGQLPLVKTS